MGNQDGATGQQVGESVKGIGNGSKGAAEFFTKNAGQAVIAWRTRENHSFRSILQRGGCKPTHFPP